MTKIRLTSVSDGKDKRKRFPLSPRQFGLSAVARFVIRHSGFFRHWVFRHSSFFRPSSFRRRTPRAFTLIEMVVSMVSATALLAALASTIFVISGAMGSRGTVAAKRSEAVEVANEMLDNLNVALSFSERTSTSVTFEVPDRDGDSNPETIHYQWSGTPGDPLLMSYNGGPLEVLAEDVHQFDLAYLTRTE